MVLCTTFVITGVPRERRRGILLRVLQHTTRLFQQQQI